MKFGLVEYPERVSLHSPGSAHQRATLGQRWTSIQTLKGFHKNGWRTSRGTFCGTLTGFGTDALRNPGWRFADPGLWSRTLSGFNAKYNATKTGLTWVVSPGPNGCVIARICTKYAPTQLGDELSCPRTLKGFDPHLVARNILGVVSFLRRICCNPFRVGLDFGTGTQGSPLRGQPWAEGGNPVGICGKSASPSGATSL